MRFTFAFIAIALLVTLIYLATVLRLPTARGMLRTLLRVGWLWAAAIIVLGVIEAFRRYG